MLAGTLRCPRYREAPDLSVHSVCAARRRPLKCVPAQVSLQRIALQLGRSMACYGVLRRAKAC